MSVTERPLAERVSLDEMIGLYDACIQLREISKHQLDLAEAMALIATNAEIAAAKSTVNQGAFVVLAYETGQIARHMGQAVSGLQEDADQLARASLLGLEKTRQLDRLHEGLSGVRRPSNQALVGQVVETLHGVVVKTFTSIRAKLDHLAEGQQAIAKQIVRVSRIATYLRIEASRDPGHGAYFLNIAEDLSRLCEAAHTEGASMQRVLMRAHARPELAA
ncbi:MAG TPA: hypothetical protein V6D05_13570 [Stenomitos sp.]